MKVFIRYFLVMFIPIYIVCSALLIVDAVQNKMQLNKGVLIAMVFILLTFPTLMALTVSAAYGSLITSEYAKKDIKNYESFMNEIETFAMTKEKKVEKVVTQTEIIYYDKNIIQRWLRYPLHLNISDEKVEIVGSKETMKALKNYLKLQINQ